MFLKQVFFSRKSLILKDNLWYALGELLFNDFNSLQEISTCFVGHSRSKGLLS